MVNPLIEKILNIMCKTECGHTCSNCWCNPSSCAKYIEYSKVAIELAKSKLLSVPKPITIESKTVEKKDALLKSSRLELSIYDKALFLMAKDFVDTRAASFPFHKDSIEDLRRKYLRYARRSVSINE